MLILIIDDDEVDYINVKRLLNKAFNTQIIDTTWVKNPQSVDIMSELGRHDICFIDQNIGQESGIEIVRNMSTLGNITPMVLLTGVHDQQVDALASEYGASDYLLKDEITPQLLNRVVRFSLAQKEYAKKLIKLAYTDGLTGLDNRIKFDQSLAQALAYANRTKTYLSLAVIDLDSFKSINDNYGHGAGDAVLVDISARLRECVRETDIIARLGGDEFAVVFTGSMHRDQLHSLFAKLVDMFQTPVEYEHQNLCCLASIGVSIYSPDEDIPSISALLREADDALYQIKKQGKNSYMVFNPLMRDQLEKAASMERQLSCSIDNNELYLSYQPKLSVMDQKVSGVEALLRWRNQAGENIPPSIFIPIAERSGFILSIGRWVIERSCRQLRQWLDQGVEAVPVAVNISVMQLESRGFSDHVLQTLAKYKLAPQLLELEITETALMDQFTKAAKSMVSLAKIGCRWSIDDFGTGYSSLSRLNDLPISKIKIDRSFIENIETSESCQKICNSIISLANAMDLTVVVEGVEAVEQMLTLPLSAQDEVQGFYYSKPLEPQALIEYIELTQRSELLNPAALSIE